MKTTKKIAVIGLGNIGKTIANNLVKNNHPLIVASRNQREADEFADQSKGLVTSREIATAIAEADIIIPAIWFNTFTSFFVEYNQVLGGKIVVDVSNPIAPDGNGGFKKIIGENESAGERNAILLPKEATLVKAFGTLGAASLASATNRSPEQAVLFYASDDRTTDADIEQLIRDSGFEPLRIGGLDQSIRIEVFGDLHEFGALGKVVSLAEAKEKI